MTKKTTTPDRQLVQFMLRAQQLARKDVRADEGSAMLIASIVTILLFSMLGAFLTMTNLNKSAANAYIDGSNTFYAAEAGLNRRAEQLRRRFVGYVTPSGLSPGAVTTTSIVTPANIINCFPSGTNTTVSANDFACLNYPFRYNNNIARSSAGSGETVLSEEDNNNNSINYVAYTFVADKTACSTASTTTPCSPQQSTIPSDQIYGGLLDRKSVV